MYVEAGDCLSRWREGYWEVKNTPWHKTETNDSLVKYWHKVTQGRQGLRVLFPLCGASVDLSWLYRQNDTVGWKEFRKAWRNSSQRQKTDCLPEVFKGEHWCELIFYRGVSGSKLSNFTIKLFHFSFSMTL